MTHNLRQTIGYVVAMSGRDPFEAADRYWLVFDPDTAARRLTRPIADAPEDAWKHVGQAVFDVGVAEAALGDQSNVLRNVSVRWTGPLTVDNFVKVLRIGGIGRFHSRDALVSLLANTQSQPVFGASITGSNGK